MTDNSSRIMMIVKFRSRLSPEEAWRRCTERMPEFRALPGLLQKHYVRDEATGEWGGVYLWESQAALQAYLGSELRQSIAKVYEVEGAPRIEVLTMVAELRS